MNPLTPKARIGNDNAAIFRNPPLDMTSIAATGRAIAMPTETTVRKKHRKILRKRLRIQVSRSTNAFDALRTVLRPPEFLAEIADVRIDAAIEWRKLTPEYCLDQILAGYRRACDFH